MRALVSRLLLVIFAAGVVSSASGCIVTTGRSRHHAERGGTHRHGNKQVQNGHEHCHHKNRRKLCHAHLHGPGHH